MLLLAQVPLPSFETLMNSDAGRLLFAAFIFSQLVLVGSSWLFVRSVSKGLDNLNKSFERLDQRQYDFRTDWGDDSLLLKTLSENIVAKLEGAITASNENHAAMGEMLVESATLHAETRAMLESTIAREIANATERVLLARGQALLNIVFQFPSADDCRWRLVVVKWKYPDRAVRVYKAPLFIADNNVLGNITSTGQVVRIIKHTLITGWCSITEISGDNPMKGYIDESIVTIEPLPDKLDSLPPGS